MRKERSCGIVAYRQGGGRPREYLLLKHLSGHWDFAKGHVEEGESAEETARRELREETGIQEARLVAGFSATVKYTFRKPGGRVINKTVTFFAARVGPERVKISDEHQGHTWLPYEAAMDALSYENQRALLRKVEAAAARPPSEEQA